MANIVWDDGRVSSLGGGSWTAVLADRFFGGGSIYPAFATNATGDTGQYGTLGVGFYGTGIAFHGNTPSALDSQSAYISIDGSAPYETSYGDLSPPTSLQWYQSPQLSDGQHIINITQIAGTSVDYMVISAGPNTPLAGERLIVDDGDNDITYSGTWERQEGRYTSSTNPHSGFPHGNATYQSGTAGSSAIFVFSGNDVGVYSVFNFSHIGWVTVQYTIDGNSETVTHAVTTSTSQYQAGVLQQENTLLWQSDDSLTLGNHQLTIEIVDSDGQTNYVLDYILYTPSFETLASKPDLTPTGASTSGSSASKTSGSTISTVVSSGAPGGSTNSLTQSVGYVTVSSGVVETIFPAASSNTNTSSTTKSTPVGAIAGGVVGGIAVLAILALVSLFLCRKRSKQRSSISPTLAPDAGSHGTFNPLLPILPNLRCNPANFAVEPFTATAAHIPQLKSVSSIPLTGTYSDTPNSAGLSAGGPMNESSTFEPMMSERKLRVSPGLPVIPLLPRRADSQTQDSTSISDSTDITNFTTSGSRVFQTRMQRLQELVTELNFEIAQRGENTVRAAELKGRIAELTRENLDVEAGGIDREVIRQSTATVPPPYQPRQA
ncbi:hypothetical protein H0H92_010034 [Tricholoma furcatifolium]|nr:hypothetical protein H0H92_012831 [Tricholoma furcatifolium]KAG6827899.1 hypothetical protein H0H92_010034 [Tricholoma furcatifolium]